MTEGVTKRIGQQHSHGTNGFCLDRWQRLQLNLPVTIEPETMTAHRDFRMAAQISILNCNFLREPRVIRVQKRDIFSLRNRPAGIAGRGRALVAILGQQLQPAGFILRGKRPDEIRRAVATAIVHDDHFLWAQGLGCHRLDCPGNRRLGAIRRDDRTDGCERTHFPGRHDLVQWAGLPDSQRPASSIMRVTRSPKMPHNRRRSA